MDFNKNIGEKIQQSCDFIRTQTSFFPRIGLILGSGMASIVDVLENSCEIPYEQIPHFPNTSAPSHHGSLHLGYFAGFPLAILQGRAHLYEGLSPAEVTFPIRVLNELGIDELLITSASGGLNSHYRETDLCVLVDHIDLPGILGADPLVGYKKNDRPIFTPMHDAYDLEISEKLLELARQLGFRLHKSIYASVIGPSFETPAEVRMFAKLGADLVGMSTTWEVKLARSLGLRVASLSAVTNMAMAESGGNLTLSEEDIWRNLELIVPKMRKLICAYFESRVE